MLRSQGWYVCSTDAFSFVLTLCLLAWLELLPVIALYYVMLCHVMLCYVMLCYVMLYSVLYIVCYVILWCFMIYHTFNLYFSSWYCTSHLVSFSFLFLLIFIFIFILNLCISDTQHPSIEELWMTKSALDSLESLQPLRNLPSLVCVYLEHSPISKVCYCLVWCGVVWCSVVWCTVV